MKRTAARDGRRPEEGCAVRRQSNFLSEPLLPYPPAGARLKSALARTTDCLKSNRPFTGALTMRSSRWEVSCREPAVEDGCRNPAVLPPPSRDHTLRDLLRLRQRGKISLHGPPGVQQRLRIGAVGDPGEVALILHSVGEHRPRAGLILSRNAWYTGPGLPWTSQSILSGAWGSSPSPRMTIAAPFRARVIAQCAIAPLRHYSSPSPTNPQRPPLAPFV